MKNKVIEATTGKLASPIELGIFIREAMRGEEEKFLMGFNALPATTVPKKKYEDLGAAIAEVEKVTDMKLDTYKTIAANVFTGILPHHLLWEVYDLMLKVIAVEIDKKYQGNIRSCKVLYFINENFKPETLTRQGYKKWEWDEMIDAAPMFRTKADLIVAQKIIKPLKKAING